MTGIVNQTGARSGVVGVTVGTPVAEGVPSDVVAYRGNGVSTPSGWTEFTTARGRMIVGMPSGGTDGGTVGTALTDAQDKSKSIAHSHKMGVGFRGDSLDYTDGGTYGESGTFTRNYFFYNGYSSTGTVDNAITDGMSANTTVVTSDILAYIQLVTIKKD
tara:strand:- start:1104 stop:1583 length:480 start_codon:yes stop_codon:yes gene_type:complete